MEGSKIYNELIGETSRQWAIGLNLNTIEKLTLFSDAKTCDQN